MARNPTSIVWSAYVPKSRGNGGLLGTKPVCGAKYVADRGGAYWLLDEIALIQPHDKAVAAEEFQVWTLKARPDHTAPLTCDDGNGTFVFSKDITFTDFAGRL